MDEAWTRSKRRRSQFQLGDRIRQQLAASRAAAVEAKHATSQLTAVWTFACGENKQEPTV